MGLKLIKPGQRKNNKFYIAKGTVSYLGITRSVERSTKTADWGHAKLRCDDIRRDVEREIEAEFAPERATWGQAVLPYVQDRTDEMASAGRTYAKSNEARYMKRLNTYYGPDRRLEDFTPQFIDQAGRNLYPNATAGTRRRQVTTPTMAVINRHKRGGRKRSSADRKRTIWLMPAEAERLIEAARIVDQQAAKRPLGHGVERLILALLGTGCRTSELVRLQMDNINARSGELYIGETKNNESRWAAIERSRALPALLNGPQDGAAFRTPKGQAYSMNEGQSGGQFAEAFNKARELAGFPSEGPNAVTPHVLRHTWATWFFPACGYNLIELQNRGGWRDVRTAMRYTKLAPADLSTTLKEYGWTYSIRGKLGENNTGDRLRVVR